MSYAEHKTLWICAAYGAQHFLYAHASTRPCFLYFQLATARFSAGGSMGHTATSKTPYLSCVRAFCDEKLTNKAALRVTGRLKAICDTKWHQPSPPAPLLVDLARFGGIVRCKSFRPPFGNSQHLERSDSGPDPPSAGKPWDWGISLSIWGTESPSDVEGSGVRFFYTIY